MIDWLSVSLLLIGHAQADLWSVTERISDMQQWRALCEQNDVAKKYMEDSNAAITVFAPVDDVFTYNPALQTLGLKETLSHIADSQIIELGLGKKWGYNTIIRSTINSGYIYVTQFENNPGNFSYFANAGMLCNHATNQWGLISGYQYLYKICTPIGNRPFPGTALSFIRDRDITNFSDRSYNNSDLTVIRDLLDRVPDIALAVYGNAGWNVTHTFFIPNNFAFSKVVDHNRIDREVLLAHITGRNRVLFTFPWLYDRGIHYYPSVQFVANSTDKVEDNNRLQLVMRNITDRRTGKYELFAVSQVYERYGNFRKGNVWAKIVVPNIPVQNGVVHIVDNVLGLATQTIDQILRDETKCITLMMYINRIGQLVRNYLSPFGASVTFFAPWNEGFDRIPEFIEKRLLRDPIWLEQILKMHVIVNRELTTDEITNDTVISTVDNMRHLYFVKGEWPKDNITYYVIGGGVKTAIIQENVAATNGIIHYIERVLGVPYQSIWEVLRNDTRLQITYRMMTNLQLKYSLDPWQVLTPEQNVTFFVPSDEAWQKISPSLVSRMNDGNHWQALQYVFKRHIIQGQALMYTDLRERTYIMLNDERVIVRRKGNYFELFWPRRNIVARIIQGGEIAGINGYMHIIDNVLIAEPDLRATAAYANGMGGAILVLLVLRFLNPRLIGNLLVFTLRFY